MEKLQTNYTCHHGVLTIDIIGIPKPAEYMRIMRDCYGRFDFQHTIWDFRGSSLSGLSNEIFEELGKTSRLYEDKRGYGAKTAVLVNNEVEVLLCRAYSDTVTAVSKLISIRFKAFLSPADAHDWLKAD